MVEVACWDNRIFRFSPDSTAFLVIDMQHDFLAPDGYVAVTYGDVQSLAGIVPRVSAVLEAARKAGSLVIHTREGYAPDGSDVNAAKRALGYVGDEGPNGPFLIRGTRGHDFLQGFEPEEDELVVDKPGFSAFYSTVLGQALRDRAVSHLIITGITTQCCVHSTLRDAVDRGFLCLSLEDCCAANDPVVHDATMKIIQAEDHLFGWISSSSALLDAIGK